MATRKLTCTVTGNWQYVGQERWDKLSAAAGGDEELIATHVSRDGKKIQEGKMELSEVFQNKIPCIVTGVLCFCSPERLEKKIKEGRARTENEEFGEADVRAEYVSRVATRLRKKLANAVEEGKSFLELTVEQRTEIDEQIGEMAANGNLPAPSAPKGSKKAKVEETEEPEGDIEVAVTHDEDTSTKDTTPEDINDPLRQVQGESKKARKNRIRRERAALKKAEAS